MSVPGVPTHMSGWVEAVTIVLMLTGRASPLQTSVAPFPGPDRVWLKNRARSRRCRD
ncbi:MAG TPA: hypothetical protein VNP04_30530 [Alphaproteobacteria bacterium]|nr:hypothetical protein [Alphaproteobacteria bacterium]